MSAAGGRTNNNEKPVRRLAIASTIALLASAPLAHADPDAYVHVPAVEYGEREIEFRLGTASPTDDHRESAAALAFGYGITTWWATEIAAKWHRSDATSFDEFEWENRFQLTEPGQYFADFGLLIELERPRDRAEGYEFKIGPLMQKDFGALQANFNVIVERHFHASEPEQTELGYEWQLRYHYRPAFDFGAQGFGGVGTWDDWSPLREQQHIAGPAIFGKFNLGGRQVLKYDAAVLFRLTEAAPATTVRAQLEYEF